MGPGPGAPGASLTWQGIAAELGQQPPHVAVNMAHPDLHGGQQAVRCVVGSSRKPTGKHSTGKHCAEVGKNGLGGQSAAAGTASWHQTNATPCVTRHMHTLRARCAHDSYSQLPPPRQMTNPTQPTTDLVEALHKEGVLLPVDLSGRCFIARITRIGQASQARCTFQKVCSECMRFLCVLAWLGWVWGPAVLRQPSACASAPVMAVSGYSRAKGPWRGAWVHGPRRNHRRDPQLH